MNPKQLQELYCTAEEAAKILRVSPRTLANKRSLREGPEYRRVGNRCLYPLHALHKYIEARKVVPESGN